MTHHAKKLREGDECPPVLRPIVEDRPVMGACARATCTREEGHRQSDEPVVRTICKMSFHPPKTISFSDSVSAMSAHLAQTMRASKLVEATHKARLTVKSCPQPSIASTRFRRRRHGRRGLRLAHPPPGGSGAVLTSPPRSVWKELAGVPTSPQHEVGAVKSFGSGFLGKHGYFL